jgi:hypothetical protein
MRIKTLAQLSGRNVRDLAANLLVDHDLEGMVQDALKKTFGGSGGSEGGAVA